MKERDAYLKISYRTSWSLLAYLLIAMPAFSQDVYINRSIADFATEVQWNKKTNISAATIAGSPYLHDDFQEGVVYLDGKYKVDHVPMRLNLHSGDMEFKSKNTVMVIAEPAKVDKIVIGQEVFLYLEKEQKGQVSGFVKQWNDSLPAIITKMKVDFFPKEAAKPYVEPKPDRYERAPDEIFLLIGEGNMERVSTIKKLIQSLGAHESELQEYAKKEKTSASDPAELAAFIDYFRKLD
jgi:hypothetical protein